MMNILGSDLLVPVSGRPREFWHAATGSMVEKALKVDKVLARCA